jgi:carbon monoxide dehydrogenase subunit G
MIRCEATIDVPRPPAEVFAFLDDPANNARYMSMCASLEETSAPPRGAGSTLRYRYKEGAGTGEMTGAVAVHQPPRRLAMTFADAMFDVLVAYAVAPSGGGSRVEHVVEIAPRKFAAKLMTPLIRLGARKQMAKDMAKLKDLLSTGN